LPNFAAIAGWKANAVRLPLNEASWLGLTVTYNDGSTASADPSGDYQATVIASVKAANAAGLYVILDLHWNAPGNFAPVTQNPFMDSDHSLDFWTSIANAFKDNPAVLFELFNEPYLHPASSDGDGVFPDNQNWNQAIRNGGITAMYYRSLNGRTSGSQVNEGYSWTVVGYQAALNAIRATGATNVVIMGGQGYDNDETWWTQYPPSDPLQQIALNYHAYESGWGYDPTGNSAEYTAAQSIAVLAGPKVPVIFTEMGAAVGNGVSTTYMTELTQLLDGEAWSGMAWTWNPWGGSNTLIQNITSYTPTPGEGTTYYAWTFNHK
jgi:hypothetical protein